MPTKKPAAKKSSATKATAIRTREQVLTAAQAKALSKTTRAANKTVPTKQPFAAFVKTVPDERRRNDAKRLDAIIRDVTGEKPVMWGDAIVGYGIVKQTYATGRVVDWMRVGFAPRKAAISLYMSCDLTPLRRLLDKMGPHTTGVGCIYVKRLDDLDEQVLRKLIERAYALAPQDTQEVWQERRAKKSDATAPKKVTAGETKATADKKATASQATKSKTGASKKAATKAATKAAQDHIGAYLATVDEPKRSTLQSLRETIRAIVPDATETISYGMPAFRLGNTTIAGFAAFKDHCAYLPFSGSTLTALAGDLTEYTHTKSSLHFPVDKPLPKSLVKKLIAERRREAGL